LVPPNNKKIHQLEAISGLAKMKMWTGLMKVSGQNYTTWVDGKSLTYTDWDTGNPAALSTENCVMF
jgi:hypothetical protein